MLRNLMITCTRKSLHFYTHSKCSSVGVCPVSYKGTAPFHQGYQYDEIPKTDSYKIRAVLYEIFDHNLEVGIQLAYQRLIETIATNNTSYLRQITHPKLGCFIERQFDKPSQVIESRTHCKDIIYTNITAKIGDTRTKIVQRLSLFDFIDIDVYSTANCLERLELDSCNLSVECYVLSPYFFNDQGEDEDSCYHRVVVESSSLKKLSKPITIFDLTLLTKAKRRKLLQDYFLGKRFEWRIKEVDSFEE